MGNFFKYAVLTAVTVLTASSFISCDKEEDEPKFESKTIKVELPTVGGTAYAWEWTNRSQAAADATGFAIVSQNDSSTVVVGGPETEIWTFTTKESGEKELKFRYAEIDSNSLPEFGGGLEEYYKATIDGKIKFNKTTVRDTVIKF